jgi:hypothetical protein
MAVGLKGMLEPEEFTRAARKRIWPLELMLRLF